jgi:hypothetical protein
MLLPENLSLYSAGQCWKNTLGGGITKRFPTMASNLAGISAAANYFEF